MSDLRHPAADEDLDDLYTRDNHEDLQKLAGRDALPPCALAPAGEGLTSQPTGPLLAESGHSQDPAGNAATENPSPRSGRVAELGEGDPWKVAHLKLLQIAGLFEDCLTMLPRLDWAGEATVLKHRTEVLARKVEDRV